LLSASHMLTEELRVDHQPDEKSLNATLTECRRKIEELEEENAYLRNAAETFGNLAERLNAERRAAQGKPNKV
jgi:predicted ribosome quality control (RQC) complex YloA/Tae2 family protein